MNIKYIANLRLPTPRAHGYAIMKMCEQFSLSGCNVDLITPKKKENDSVKNPFDYYNISKTFNILQIKGIDLMGATTNFGKLFYWVDLLYFFISLKLKTNFKKDEVIYTRDFVTPLIFLGSFICLELHDIPESNFLFNLAIKKPKLFFVLNNNLKKELIKRGVPEEKVHIFPSGIDLKEFDLDLDTKKAKELVGLSTNKKIVLYSGQFYSWKGLDTLAKAAKFLPEYTFVFIGGTEPELSRFKNEYGNLQNVIIESFKERSVVPLYLKSADVLVIPQSKKEKISTHYSSPLKMLEYMASKRPIVASNLSSIREMLDENSCVFAESGDAKSFASSIKKVLEDEAFSKIISENAYEKVKKFSWEKRAKGIIDLINKNVSENH